MEEDNPIVYIGSHNKMVAGFYPAIDPAHGRKIAKDKSIDGLVALAMAIGLYNREPAPLIYDFNRPLGLSV